MKEASDVDADVSVSVIMDKLENMGLKADDAFIYLKEAVDDIKMTINTKPG